MAFTLSDDDKAFIAEISARFPGREIERKFNDYLARDAKFRVKTAEFDINFVPRNGWKRVGIPGLAQTVRNHMDTLHDMTALTPVYNYHPDALCINVAKLQKMLAIHDLGEAIISDFTPYDNLSRAEKKRLERLAVNIIFEAHPEMIALWEEYEEKKTVESLFAHDLDILEPILHAEILKKQFPERAANLQEFWNGMERALYTKVGKAVFAALQNTPETAGEVNKYQRVAQTFRALNGPQ